MIKQLILVGLFFSIIKGQIISTIDTISALPYTTEIKLDHELIVDTSFSILEQDLNSIKYSLDPIKGILFINNQKDKIQSIIIKYDYYSISLPIKIGPKMLNLPQIDSLIINKDLKNESELILNPVIKEKESIYSSGTFFRNLNISPRGGSEFNGGFQMQIQGSLGNDIQVSGVLSDQNFPIQPEGNTSTLDEIDKIYFQINHNNFAVTAGDVDVNINSGRFLNISRKTVGINNQFKFAGLSGGGSIAGSKGITHQVEFKGIDRKQGPYSLTSKNGNRDIMIVAGSENVWLNGIRLNRGEENDYTIDYSIGEIFFMPKNIIYFDSDIYIEYEYSGEQYNRSLLSSSINKELKNNGNFQLSWFREYDQTSNSNNRINNEVLSIFKNLGDKDAYISGALEDSTGMYVYIDSIYIYDSTNTSVGQHYQVSFTYDNLNGEYVRKLSNNGILYYQWLDRSDPIINNQLMDFYSPVRKLVTPERQQLIQALSNYHVNDWLALSMELAVSDYDKNTLSNMGDTNNKGLGHQLKISGDKIRLNDKIEMGYEISQWGRNKSFNSLQRDRSVQFNQDWNISPIEDKNEKMQNITSTVSIDSLLRINTMLSNYKVGSYNKDRTQIDFIGKNSFIENISGRVNQVRSNNENFQTVYLNTKFLSGSIHPVINYVYERSDRSYHFQHLTSGLEIKGKRLQSTFGIGRREDYVYHDNNEVLLSNGYFGEFDMKFRSSNGWNHSVIYRKRVKTEALDNQKINYDLLQARTSLRKPRAPLRFDARFKVEEVLTENRIIVYDSVGIGLGTHRYDQEFEEYIPDPNGAFISYSVLSGSRIPTTKFEGIQRLEYDFSKKFKSMLKDVKYRMDWKWDFNGQDFDINQYGNNNITNTSIVRSKSKLLNELNYLNQDGRQIKIWNIAERDLNSLDPRGPDLKTINENGADYLQPILNEMHIGLKVDHHRININSSFSPLRDRSAVGYWSEIGLKKRMSSVLHVEGHLQFGYDEGLHQLDKYTSRLRGLRIELLHFFSSKGRIQMRYEWSNVNLFGQANYLPPEALRGNSIGENKRANMNGNIFLKENFSINLNINYISDIRYTNFINLSGEIRAYF